jgi:hypothetical protein
MNSIAGESSGREAVKLAGVGQHVEFKAGCTANSIVVRYVIPDSADGAGMSATLGLYIGGTRVQSLTLTSKYAWAYGDPSTTDGTSNNPGDGYARHFYDEVRVLLPSDIPAGTTVALQQDGSDTAAYYVIDLIDLEEVPPATPQPPNSLSITTCGATPDDGSDDGEAILNCLNQASKQGMIAWIPEGTFNDAATWLSVNVTVKGAGMWRSTIAGASAGLDCPGGPCSYSDLSLYGEVTQRDDAHGVFGVAGAFGSGSTVENIWMEHFTVGAWIGLVNTPGASANITNLTISGCRMRDLFADGVNLNNGTTSSTVKQCHARGTGDDSFASWSSGPANTNNVFQFDTAEAPWRATCFAIYGGANNTVEDSVCGDGVTYPGILVDQEFNSTAFGGTTSILRDDVLRSGGDMFQRGWGGVTVYGNQPSSPVVGVTISDVNIESATYPGVYLFGLHNPIQDLVLDNVTISQPGTYGILIDQPTSGNATASNVVVTSPGKGGLNNAASGTFTLAQGTGNVGW